MNSPVLLDVPSLSLSVRHIQGTDGGLRAPGDGRTTGWKEHTHAHTNTHLHMHVHHMHTHKHGRAYMCTTSHMYAGAAKSLQSCPTLCDPIDGSPPGSSVPGILQARTLEWVAISFSNA